jgi:hypothetical protein
MQTDYSVFSERLAEACRGPEYDARQLCASIGMGGKRSANFFDPRPEGHRSFPTR